MDEVAWDEQSNMPLPSNNTTINFILLFLMGRMKKVGCWRALAPKGMNEQREEKTKGFWWTARFHFPRRTVELLVWVVLFFGGLWPLPAAGAPPKEENNNTKPTRMSWWKEDWWMNGNEWINLSFHCSGGRLGAQRAGCGMNEQRELKDLSFNLICEWM